MSAKTSLDNLLKRVSRLENFMFNDNKIIKHMEPHEKKYHTTPTESTWQPKVGKTN
jgi:hypothetical protein